MYSASDTHKRPKLDLEKFSNSKVLSDITIRYGASGELKFEAHRVLLSAQSRWFEAAFTGGFAESHAREITLIGDDPDALKTMLGFVYVPQICRPAELLHGATDTINHFLGLYRVGDKYQFPAFLVPVASKLKRQMRLWLGRSRGPLGKDCVAQSEFCGFIRDIYELVGSEHQPSHPLVQILLGIATERGSASVLNNIGGNQPLIVMASQKVAEYGRDIFLHLMDKTGVAKANDNGKVVTTELCIGVVLECPPCSDISWKVIWDDEESLDEEGECTICGLGLQYWKKGDEYCADLVAPR